MRTTNYALYSWKELEELAKDEPVVFVPLGAVEPHGPQLPTGADYLVAEHLAHEAAKVTNSLVLPTLPFGYCDTVRDTPGTITLEPATLTALMEDVLTSLAHHGFKRIIIVNNHRSNAAILGSICRHIRQRHNVEIATFFPWGTIIATGQDLYEDFGSVFGHGGEPETSVMSYLQPDHIRMDLAQDDQYGTVWGQPASGSGGITFKGAPIDVYLQAEEISATGTRGKPSVYSPERGEELVKRALNILVEFTELFKTVEPLKVR